MKFTLGRLSLMVVVVIVASAVYGAYVSGQIHDTVRFSVLFDLGDGTIYWTTAYAFTSATLNSTWDAVQTAASQLALWITWSWSSCCGVFIQDIGNRSPPAGAVGLFVWNTTSHEWELAPVGISSLVVTTDDVIALSDGAFDPVTYATIPPLATPDHPYPAAEFRGDGANTGASNSSAPDGLQVAWDRNLGVQEIESAPVVVGPSVYVLTMDGFFALNETTGAVLWQNLQVKGLSTPAFFGGTLLVGGSDGRVHAVNATNGAELWNVTLLPRTLFSGITSSPKVVFETAYVGTFNESGGLGEVVALWAANGTIQWRHTAPGSISFSTPAVGDGTAYVGIIGRYNTTTQITYDPPFGVLALEADTGAQRWFTALNGSVPASPVFTGTSILVPCKDGFVYALDPATGVVLWRKSVSAGVSSPALNRGTLFVAGGSGSFGGPGLVTAINASTAATEWTFAPNGAVQTAVTWANGLVFFSTNVANGTIYALDAATGALAWSYTPSPAQYIFGSPVVADGYVFAPSDNGHVYAIRAPRSLVSLHVAAPSSLALGETSNVTIHVADIAGRAVDAQLHLILTEAVVVSSTPAVTSNFAFGSSTAYIWNFGVLPFGSNITVTAEIRGQCSTALSAVCRIGSVTQTLNLGYNGTVSEAYDNAVGSFDLTITNAAPPQSVLWLGVGVGLALLAVAAAAIILFLRRRRSQRGP